MVARIDVSMIGVEPQPVVETVVVLPETNHNMVSYIVGNYGRVFPKCAHAKFKRVMFGWEIVFDYPDSDGDFSCALRNGRFCGTSASTCPCGYKSYDDDLVGMSYDEYVAAYGRPGDDRED